eukprot:1154888-Pelagomonas_calceolata.AAC.2
MVKTPKYCLKSQGLLRSRYQAALLSARLVVRTEMHGVKFNIAFYRSQAALIAVHFVTQRTAHFATLFSPDAHAAAKSKRLDSMGGGRGPGGGRPGGGGGGPRGGRIVGVDKLGGGGGGEH